VDEPVIAKDIFDRLRQAAAKTPGVLEELCREFVVEARAAIVQIRTALSESNAEEMRNRAHYLKGSSMIMGARVLSQCCAKLESMGRVADLGAADAEVDHASAALEAVEAELSRELGPSALPQEGSAA